MKAAVLKRDKRYETRNDKSYGIQQWGEANDYPQRVLEIISASGTGASCVEIYAKFIAGKGFADVDFYKMIVNDKGQTNDYIIDIIKSDYAALGGFALHVNYNALFEIVEIQHIPFETIRFEKLDDNTQDFSRVAIHPDWGRRFLSLRKWKKDDIQFIDLFNPNPEEIQKQVDKAGGWENYKGQVLYFSNQGEKCYSTPIADTVLTDMSTEEGVSNVSYRNARNNFLAAGMLVDIKDDNDSVAGKIDDDDRQRKLDSAGLEDVLIEFQGDEEAGKLLYTSVNNKDEVPQFVSFKGNNYDKEFTVTTETAENKIGKRFMQPPILRSVDVGGNFGADLMKNAYNYYNSITESERLVIERTFAEIFKYWHEKITTDFSIIPLSYDVKMSDISEIPLEVLNTLTVNEKRALIGYEELQNNDNNQSLLADKIGVGGTQSLVSIVADPNMSKETKRGLLKTLFALDENQLNEIIPLP